MRADRLVRPARRQPMSNSIRLRWQGPWASFGEISLKLAREITRKRKRKLLPCAAVLAAALALAVEPASAQTPYVPYFGKNQIRYDKFEWYHYETDHFIIYYYPEIE